MRCCKIILVLLVLLSFCNVIEAKKVKFPNGDVYVGKCEKKIPHGQGTMYYSDGSYYIGNWEFGKRCGKGAMKFANEDYYEGEWKNDIFEGQGVLKSQKDLNITINSFINITIIRKDPSKEGTFVNGSLKKGIIRSSWGGNIEIEDGTIHFTKQIDTDNWDGYIEIKCDKQEGKNHVLFSCNIFKGEALGDQLIQVTGSIRGIFTKYLLQNIGDNKYKCNLYYGDEYITYFNFEKKFYDFSEFCDVGLFVRSFIDNISDASELRRMGNDMRNEKNFFEVREYGEELVEKAASFRSNSNSDLELADMYYKRNVYDDRIKAYHLYKKISDTEKDGYSTYMAYLCFKAKGYDLVDDISTLPKERMRLLNLAISRGSKAAVQEKARVLKEEKQAKINSAKAQAENKKKAEYNRKHPTYMAECKYCWGNGKNLLNLNETCAFCNGRGWVIKRR